MDGNSHYFIKDTQRVSPTIRTRICIERTHNHDVYIILYDAVLARHGGLSNQRRPSQPMTIITIIVFLTSFLRGISSNLCTWHHPFTHNCGSDVYVRRIQCYDRSLMLSLSLPRLSSYCPLYRSLSLSVKKSFAVFDQFRKVGKRQTIPLLSRSSQSPGCCNLTAMRRTCYLFYVEPCSIQLFICRDRVIGKRGCVGLTRQPAGAPAFGCSGRLALNVRCICTLAARRPTKRTPVRARFRWSTCYSPADNR